MSDVALAVKENQDIRRVGREGKLRFLCQNKFKPPKHWYMDDVHEGTKYHGELLRKDLIFKRYHPEWDAAKHGDGDDWLDDESDDGF